MKLSERLDKLSDQQLDDLPLDKLEKLYDQACRGMNKAFGPGGKEYGIDWPTLAIVLPDWYARLKKISLALKRRQAGLVAAGS